MRHPPVLLRPAAAQTAVPDPAPIAVSSVSAAAAVQTGPTTANGNSLQHLYSNTGAANHLHTSLPCSSTLHSYSSSAGGGGASFSANGSHNNSTSNNATISDNHNVTHGGPQSSLNSSTTTPTPATSGGGPASAFSGSAHSLIGPLLPSARRYVAVRLLTGETLQFDVEVKSKGKELYAAVARHMSSLGMKSPDIFGLAIQIDGEYLFVDPENKLGKYAPKGWKSSHASGLNNAGHPLLVLYFRVKFYVDSHLLIRDRVTRQHYYYQLRENVLRHGQPATEESFFRLAALALQAELGDYDPERHRAAYFDTQLYFPQWILERVGVDYVVQNMPAMHRDHRCLSTGSAQLLYIKEASSGHTHYGLHLYRLRSSKKSDDHNQQQLQLQQQQQQQQQHHAHSGSSSSHNNAHRLRSAERAGCDSRLSDRGASVTLDRPSKTHKLDAKIESVLGLPSSSSSTDDSSNSRTPLDRTASQRPCSANENPTIQQQLHEQQQPHTGTVWLGICGRGIDIYEEEDSFTKTVRATFQWPNIGKLCFERKKFEIRAVGCPESRKFTYYTSSDDKSKHLLYLCRVTHQFSMAMQPKLAELRKLEEEANRHYQESMGEGTAVEMGGWCDPGSSLERPDRLSLRGYGSLSKGRGGGSQAHGDQRISVISSTSSNTTSGIVSDKVQSVDESEDELDLDERTRPSPAAAPSLESLALAHLRDSCDSLPAELERRNEAESAMQLRPAAQNLTSGNSQQSSSTTLPRRLAGLGARLARVGRSSNKAATSATAQTSSASATLPTSSEMSRTGSLHSSSSQHSASTIHSRSRSKSRISPSTTNGWPGCDLTPSSDRVTPTTSNSSASWLRLNSVDVTDGIASMRLQSAAEENQRRSEMVGCQSSSNGNGAAGPGDHNQPHNSGMEEENQYWYSCDDDISETGSTNGEKCPAGVLCTDCRMGIVCCSGSQSQQHHRHHHHRGHEDLPDHHHHHHHNHHVNHHHHHLHHAKDPSESSSLCVSVDHTTQDSTLSDCQSYFHSHVSSVDSSLGGSAPPHPLIPAPEMANTPLAATVSALSNGGSLRSLRSAKVSVASASDDCGSAVDYSVQSGPAADSSSSSTSSAAAAAAAAMCASPKLDFTVTSAVPNTGTYPRRSTVSNTLDSDSDYVTLPPLCSRMQDSNVVMVPNSYVFMEPMQPKNGGQVTVACVNQLSLRHGVNCKMVDDVASTTYSAHSCSSSQMMGLTRPMSAAASAAAAAAAAAASEAAARFITTRPTISILQAHTASTAPATQPSFATPAQHLIPPPPYDIRQHPLYNQQQQQQQQSYHPAQIQAQFQSMDGSSSSAGLTCCQYVPPPAGYSSCQQTDAFEPPPPPPPYPIHLQVQAPLTTANLGLHLSQQSVSSLVSKHSLNSMASSARSLEAVSDSHRIVPNNSHAVYAEDSLNDTKTNGSSSLYGVITTDPEVAASVAGSSGAQVAPVIGKNNYLDIHATNTLSRRPQHPIPSGAQQQSASAQIVQQVNGTVTGGASVPYEQYHLGIPPPPQYPGSGGGSNGVNSSKASFATVYTNQVTQSQIEQFKAQLYSDVDYVIYPHKDPSLSQQEYLDVKEAASFISSAASSTYSDQGQMMLMGDGAYLPPPPPYRAPSTKSGASSVYRSSPMPNVHLPPVSSTGGIVLSGTTPASHPPLQHLGYGYSSHHQGAGARPASVHYASNQSLSSGNYSSSYSTSNYSSNYSAQVPMAYVPYPSKYLSCQSLASSHSSNPSAAYSASGCYSASSSHSMTGSYEPIGAAIQHAGAALRCKPMAPLPALSRVHSEESILTYDLPQVTTLSSAIARHQEARGLLPPPPPYRKQSLDTPSAPGSTCSSGAPSIATDSNCPSEGGKLPGQKTPLDIKTLREKSRNLDLPLISALCNDTTLLNQAKRKPPMGQQQQQQLQQQQQQLQQQQLQQQQLQQQPQQMQQQQPQQQQQQSVSNIQSMPLPPTPIEAAQGKTTGQPPPKPGGQVNGQSHAYVMPRHPASVSMSQAESSPCRRPALTTPRRNPVAAVQQASQSRPTSWHVDGNNWNVGQGDPAVNGEKSNAPPPPLPPPNSNSAIEAKLQQLQKAAVAIATGPGSIIAEDGKIAKALNLPAFAKSVKNSYVVSPSRKHPVSGLYAVTELGKPPSGSRKIPPTAFSHPHNNAGSKVSQHTVPNSSSLSNGKTSFGVVP